MPHILVDITGHGYGHLSQTAPVLNALTGRRDDIKLSVRSTLSIAELKRRIDSDFDYHPSDFDFGLEMFDAIQVDRARTFERYQNLHADYEVLIANETSFLTSIQPDLLLSNIPYHSIEAASGLGMPVIALCSLNWAHLFNRYCAEFEGANPIFERMLFAYNQAKVFMQPEPSMSMPGLKNLESIGPISRKGKDLRAALVERLKVSTSTQIVLVGVGGMTLDFDVENWPHDESIFWIMPENVKSEREDMINVSALEIAYVDLIASVDLVITKTGYGMIVESITQAKPVICISRHDWPEEAPLFEWAKQNGVLTAIEREDLGSPKMLKHVLKGLNQAPIPVAVKPDGAQAAASIISQQLQAGSTRALPNTR